MLLKLNLEHTCVSHALIITLSQLLMFAQLIKFKCFFSLSEQTRERERERERGESVQEKTDGLSFVGTEEIDQGGSQGVKVLIETVQIDITDWLNPLFVATAPSLSHTLPPIAISRREI
jgi:hypothetical protein